MPPKSQARLGACAYIPQPKIRQGMINREWMVFADKGIWDFHKDFCENPVFLQGVLKNLGFHKDFAKIHRAHKGFHEIPMKKLEPSILQRF